MLAVVPQWIIDVGIFFGVLATVFGVFVAVVKAKPTRWLARNLIGDPVTEWHAEVTTRVTTKVVTMLLAPIIARLEAIEHEMHPNGGDGLRDQVDHLVIQVGEIRRNSGV